MPHTTVPSTRPSSTYGRRLPLAAIGVVTALAAALLGGALPAQAAGTISVGTSADGDANNACTDPNVTATALPVTLRNAICVANNLGGAQTVSVPAGTYRLAANSGALQVGTRAGANITIDGGTTAPTIVGDGTHQVFLLDPQTIGNVSVTLAGLTVTGGVDNVFGGGAVVGGSPDPAAPDSLTINGSVFSGNAANTTGGSTANPGGAVQFIGGSLVVQNSTFTNNDAGVGSGGAIYYQTVGTQGQKLSVTGSTFTGNRATATGVTGGSAIAVSDPSGGNSLSISGSTISGNTVTAGTGAFHGAVWLDGGALDVSSSVLTGNTGTTGDGSAVSVTSGTLTGQYDRITGNGGAAVDRIGGSVALTRSWWGCNGGPGGAGCDTVAGAVTVSPVLTLALAASPTTVLQPATMTQVTASLVDALGATPPAGSLGAFAGLSVAWSVGGIAGASVSPSSTALASGSASTTFTSARTGSATVSAAFAGGWSTLAVPVYALPVVTTAGPLTAVVGTPSTATVTATGYPVPTLSLVGSAPAGLVFHDNGDGTGSFTGTPTGPAGDTAVSILAHNAAGDATRPLTFSVYQAPAFTSANATTFSVGSAGSFTVTTSGRPSNPAVTVSGALPAGVTFHDNGDGTATIAGTPAAGAGGVAPLTLTANNGQGSPAVQSFALTVQEAPRLTSGTQATARVGVPFSYTVTTAHAYPVPTLGVIGALPAGLAFHDNGDGTATISGTPAGPGQTAALTVSAANGVGPVVTASLTLLVEQLPAITTAAQNQSVATGGTATFTAAASGYPAPTVQWAVSADGGATYQDLPGETAPTLSFTAALSDSGHRYRATFTNQAGAVSTDAALTVGQTPLITSSGGTTFTVGTAGSFRVTTSGIPAAALTASGTLPGWLSFTDAGDGTATIAGTPPAGSGGVHTFTITAANGYLPQATQSFALTVAESPAITSAAAGTLTAGTAGGLTVTTTAGYPAATALHVSGALPSGVRFVDNGDGTGSFTGTPAAGSGGVYPVTVTAANTLAPAASQSYTLTVNEAAAFTSAATLAVERGVDVDFRIVTGHAYPAVGAIALSGTLPSGLAFHDNGDGTATITGITLDPAGVGTVTLTAGGATQTLSVTVADVPALSLPLLPPAPDGPVAGVLGSPVAGQSVTLTASGFAGDSPVTFGIYSSPVALATVNADSSGVATATVVIPAGYTGAHSLVAVGTAPDGSDRVLRTDIQLPGASTGTGGGGSGGSGSAAGSGSGASTAAQSGLAATGSDVTPVALLALSLLAAGALLLVRRRARRA
ncbi:beta strand repeat-containing protein [Leifsonia shinshuensis]|uniref:Ig-like domain-containing protein n=1 Tax=Leifsonia shinshuensis TaxID=150026 RepID=A0A853CSD2_9MICO|nr:putative Ig domain-containing protein [Leifsonia shinshuensis]NYJ22381.1 hypothetical protein [Leifsonia shinshuensis]